MQAVPAIIVVAVMLALDSFFYWLYFMRSGRSWATSWWVTSVVLAAILSLLVAIDQPINFVALAFVLTGTPAIVGLGFARWRYMEHEHEKANQAKQEERFRLKNPKFFE